MFREGAALSTALALVCLACSGSRPPADTAAAETTSEPVMQGAAQGFGATLSVDRHVYGTGEPIELELRHPRPDGLDPGRAQPVHRILRI